ncbi:MAG: ATP-dependent RNA helicase HrpA [Gammaproteobacteria bacterium]|nr:ATP-dependent RNA helicase HrpA [Gammaproteobacteria bacterium]
MTGDDRAEARAVDPEDPDWAGLDDAIAGCLLRDVPAFDRRIQGLRRRRRQGRPWDRGLAALRADMARSSAAVARRRAALPPLRYPEDLPVSAARAELVAAIRAHPVVVVCGDTGSGKSTQLPKLCLEAGLGVRGLVGHTQPRRIAARSLALRIAEELDTRVGEGVGFKVRFHDRVGADGHIKLMTDGILLAETQGDPDLLQYEALILDEAHERSLNIDFLLGYLKGLLARRRDLKVIITSATIDPDRLSRHFDDAPVVQVEGRSHPVEVRYRPLGRSDGEDEGRDYTQGVVEAVDELSREGPGDVLVFLPGERQIRDAEEALRKHHPAGVEILPLYARLSVAEQARVFAIGRKRRIVLATNVAETSLTVPGIRYVVDEGRARVSRYSHRSKVQRLPVEAVSRASADQRKGRCGRLGPGICIRLYDAADYEARREHTEPEIQRTNLAAVILQMAALGLGRVEDFPFVDPPDGRYIRDGYRLLEQLQAMDRAKGLTALGRRLARLPLDPKLGRMILAAQEGGGLRELLIITSALSVQDPRERPRDKRAAADALHRESADPRSEFLSYVGLWDFYHEQARHLSRNKLRALCRERYLNASRMREWHDVHQQVLGLLHDQGVQVEAAEADYETVHRAVLTGLLGNIGFKERDERYQGARNTTFQIHPGTLLGKRRPKWVVAGELVETNRIYARVVAQVEPPWIEAAGAHEVRRRYHDPHFEPRAGRVMAFERVTLFGLPLASGRRVDYQSIDSPEARAIYIREALVAGGYRGRGAFAAHNRLLVTELEELEHKSRRRDIVVTPERLFEFFDARVPADVASNRALDRWLGTKNGGGSRALHLSREDLVEAMPEGVDARRFPEYLEVDGQRLPLTYRHAPGAEEDGVTLELPLPLLNRVDTEGVRWLVPGLFRELLEQLLRALPKHYRKRFVPVPDFARAAADALPWGQGPLGPALAAELKRMTGTEVPEEEWRWDGLPDHLRMRFKLVDEDGGTLDTGRDLAVLKARWADRASAAFGGRGPAGWGREDITHWDFGDLPEVVEEVRGSLTLRGYPALVDRGDRVALRLFDRAATAHQEHRRGLRRLFALRFAPQLKQAARRIGDREQMCLLYAALGTTRHAADCDELRTALVLAAVERTFMAEGTAVRSQAEFERRASAGQGRLVKHLEDTGAMVVEILRLAREVALAIDDMPRSAMEDARRDLRGQLEGLVYPGFLLHTSARWLGHLPRFLHAMKVRTQRLLQQPDRDSRLGARLTPLESRYLALREREATTPGHGADVAETRWLLEELRVSLYAQELKTSVPVSIKKLERRLDELELGLSG